MNNELIARARIHLGFKADDETCLGSVIDAGDDHYVTLIWDTTEFSEQLAIIRVSSPDEYHPTGLQTIVLHNTRNDER